MLWQQPGQKRAISFCSSPMLAWHREARRWSQEKILTLEQEARNLLKKGIYDPHEMFKILYYKHPIHYSKVREAIHNAKTI